MGFGVSLDLSHFNDTLPLHPLIAVGRVNRVARLGDKWEHPADADIRVVGDRDEVCTNLSRRVF